MPLYDSLFPFFGKKRLKNGQKNAKGIHGFSHLQLLIFMKSNIRYKKGFTLVELLVVMAIMAILMTLAGSVLRDAGKGRSMDSAVDIVENLVREARATAMGNDTYTRLVIVNAPNDTGSDSGHLRYMAVQMMRKASGKNEVYDGTSVPDDGDWTTITSGTLLPPGCYFSPTYSSVVRIRNKENLADEDMIGEGTARLSKAGHSNVYFIEFDEKGQLVAPGADPSNETAPRRIVLINARPGGGSRAVDGVLPLSTDGEGRPASAAGIVIWPRGGTSPLRTRDQIFGNDEAILKGN